MKTTIEIPDPLLNQTKGLADRDRTTIRALVEEGLRNLIEERQKKGALFRLRRAGFRGSGLQPDVAEGSWERIRDLIYEGHGG